MGAWVGGYFITPRWPVSIWNLIGLRPHAADLRKIFFSIFFNFFWPFLTIFGNFGPFWGPGNKSVKSDLKKIWDPHRKDNRPWFEVKKWSPEFSKKVEKSNFWDPCNVMPSYDMICYMLYIHQLVYLRHLNKILLPLIDFLNHLKSLWIIY